MLKRKLSLYLLKSKERKWIYKSLEAIEYFIFVNRYLRTSTRRVQKRKTATIKGSYNPEYHAKLKYNACNVMGKFL
jgi:hypothetical protein